MGHRYVLDGRLEVPVGSPEDLDDLIARGDERKRRAATAMNERSTRAHSVLLLRLRQRRGAAVVASTLFLADLGGSEKVSKSRANEDVRAPGGFKTNNEEVSRVSWDEYYRCRQRVTETSYINQGLLALKRCVSMLNQQRRHRERRGAGGAGVQIPFRDSKLTAVLEPAFGGLSRTAIIVCCSQEEQHAEETVQSLRFGEMCGQVEHGRRQGAVDTSAAAVRALRQLDDEIAEVTAAIRANERWEWRRSVRVDLVDEDDEATTRVNANEEMELGGLGAVEFLPADAASSRAKREVEHEVWGQVIVGAETERARLESLLDRRRRLLGEA